MVALKCLAATGLALLGALATALPQSTTADVTESVDIAAQFVDDLVSNATQVADEQDASSVTRRGSRCDRATSLVVDVGYAKYQGYSNSTNGLNYWKGIRYAAAPTGNLRWQPPRLPSPVPNAPLTQATSFGAGCPQAIPSVPNAPFIPGNEDCLFLNVYAPSSAENLPVLVWIHGGGYGYGDASQDMTEIINANNNGFVVVTIQYRLGAFGFLASQVVRKKGAVNAGILDQAFALAWVKQFICQFGGDPTSVTIGGESAGGGSVLYHDIAVDGTLGSLLFSQSIANSPYLPFQYKYNDATPTSKYSAFAEAAGCPSTGDVFACLVGKDTDTLQQANYNITQQSTYGYWAFYPVTDNVYITDRATKQLSAKKVNGKKLLVGYNANEGPLFVPPSITTQSDLISWLQLEFPNLSTAQINSILAANPNSAETNAANPRFETDGLSTGYANAVNVSQAANGQQQRANNIYAEATFACPAYWMASSYTGRPSSSWLYQYSVPFAFHTTDLTAYLGPATPNQSNDFTLAFRRIWGNFITTGNPTISNALANGVSAANPSAPNTASTWPAYSDASPKLLNLNETGGTPYQATMQWGSIVTQFSQPGLKNALAVVNAASWEGGRGARCAVYRGLAPSIPA
ncbi:Alpha/Beta hydrolase protein [Podospora appendiculata]|uniref:Carboxylic ester hydrolase n=1 Tax=Podospora appendiculata TaxID=314037 RepID=A0AAE0WZX8_9PEZI|nr:Alpha/Beta hydrolase protein [Podospora appendiculata]